jgi:hypothetical protein
VVQFGRGVLKIVLETLSVYKSDGSIPSCSLRFGELLNPNLGLKY